MMTRFLVLLSLLCAQMIPTTASAQEVLFSYHASISANDLVNSRGVPLEALGDFLQQDRANYHRFGRRDSLDQPDPYFTTPEARQMIPFLYQNGGGNAQIESQVRQYGGAYILIRVYGRNGGLSHLTVSQAAG